MSFVSGRTIATPSLDKRCVRALVCIFAGQAMCREDCCAKSVSQHSSVRRARTDVPHACCTLELISSGLDVPHACCVLAQAVRPFVAETVTVKALEGSGASGTCDGLEHVYARIIW